MRSALLIAAAAALARTAVLAQASGYPHGGSACQDDWDCSLGGTCENGACACDIWFTGGTCDLLNLQRPPSQDFGLQVPSYYSWGGHSMQDESGVWHGYFSFMCNHATLSEWTTASSIVHVTSEVGIAGPYTPAADMMIIQPWAHNAMISQAPGSDLLQLFHIGNAVVDPSKWSPCYQANSTASDATQQEQEQPTDEEVRAMLVAAQQERMRAPVGDGNSGIFIHTSTSFNGPWTAWNNNNDLNVTGPRWFSGSMNNPAPFYFDNGTVLMYFAAAPCPPGWGNASPECIGLAIADSWNGTYTVLPQPLAHPESEDPFVFRDPRGNFHMLTNVNNCHARCAQGVPCGGHAWSRDGLNWSNFTIGAFGPVITFTNGSVWQTAYVERPQVVQDENGVPMAFFVGMGRSSYVDSASWVQLFCNASSPAGSCGPTKPPPPTAVKYVQGGQCLISNSSFPCPGGWANSCPVFLGSCDDPTAVWLESGTGSISNQHITSSSINVDCNDCTPRTLVKLFGGSGDEGSFSFNATAGQLQWSCPSGSLMCLNGGQGTPNPPCKAGEFYLSDQTQLDTCGAAGTQGWTRQVVSAVAV